MEKVKRPRPQLSCTPCRKRKLKCDRESPCGQCVKSKRTNECGVPAESGAENTSGRPAKRSRQSTTEPRTLPFNPSKADELPNHATDNHFGFPYHPNISTHDLYDPRVPDLLLRMEALERAFTITQSTQATTGSLVEISRPQVQSTRAQLEDSTDTSSNPPRTCLNINGSRVRYQGGSHRYALIEQFAEVRAFIPEAIKDVRVVRALKDMQRLQKSRTTKLDITRRIICVTEKELKTKLVDLLDPWAISEMLINYYFEYWETVYRIVHKTHFKEILDASRKSTAYNPNNLDISILLQLILMVAIGNRRLSNENVLSKDFINDACALAQGYLDTCPPKMNQEFSTLQIKTLLLLTHQVYLVAVPKIWLETGNLIRHAMAMGLHRDPSEAKGIAPYMGELRRRLWATILEFDIQASLVYGMPMSISAFNMTCKLPQSISDEELKQDCTEEANKKAAEAGPRRSMQLLFALSRNRRMRAVEILAGRADRRTEIEVAELCRLCQSMLQELSPTSPVCLGEKLKNAHICQVYLQLQQISVAEATSKAGKERSDELSAMMRSLEEMYKQTFGHEVRLAAESSSEALKDDDWNYLVLTRRTLLQASLMWCSCLKLLRETDSKNSKTSARINRDNSWIQSVLNAFIAVLPIGDVKDILLLALAVQSLDYFEQEHSSWHAAMMEGLLLKIECCTDKLKSKPGSRLDVELKDKNGSQRSETVAPTPDSVSTTATDSILGPLEDISFADIDFGYLDDWQEADGLSW